MYPCNYLCYDWKFILLNALCIFCPTSHLPLLWQLPLFSVSVSVFSFFSLSVHLSSFLDFTYNSDDTVSVGPSLILCRSIHVVTNGEISLFSVANIPLCIHTKYIHLYMYMYVHICVHIYLYIHIYGFPSGSVINNPPEMQETQVQSLGQKGALKAGMATHSSILA